MALTLYFEESYRVGECVKVRMASWWCGGNKPFGNQPIFFQFVRKNMNILRLFEKPFMEIKIHCIFRITLMYNSRNPVKHEINLTYLIYSELKVFDSYFFYCTFLTFLSCSTSMLGFFTNQLINFLTPSVFLFFEKWDYLSHGTTLKYQFQDS